MYPFNLSPVYSEEFELETGPVEVPKSVLKFQKWKDAPLKESFGGKDVVTLEGEGMFVETAILHLFQNSGWQARWISTVGKANSSPIFLNEWKDDTYNHQTHEPIEDVKVLEILEKMVQINHDSYMGCWDIISWDGETILFTKAIRNNKDFMRKIHLNWLSAGLSIGLKPENFLLVQWDYNPRQLL